ncbi:MAG: homoserine dehydrogenase, partial [Flavisolibacter sp.]|nr:homoserine dehydrogenase [Flavisolibacter sp.]
SDGTVAAFVLPHFITDESQLFYVKDEFNGIVIESKLADKQFLYGKGAGRYPTSSAVLSDIAALRYQYKYEYRKLNSPEKATLAKNYYLKVYVSFERWEDINKNDFEQVVEFYSTGARQYLVGVIHVEKLQNASWLNEPSVSVIMMPNGIIEKDVIVTQSLKKVSLHLAGVI